jgi:hypothetical protein
VEDGVTAAERAADGDRIEYVSGDEFDVSIGRRLPVEGAYRGSPRDKLRDDVAADES